MKTHLVWFRNDLRVDDNPALANACFAKDDRVFACYLLARKQWSQHKVGNNQQALIVQALKNLSEQLSQLNIALIVKSIDFFRHSASTINQLCDDLDVSDLHFNIEYPFNERVRDKGVVEQLKQGVECHRYVADSLTAPWEVMTQAQAPFKVFTPYSKAVLKQLDQNPVACFHVPAARSRDNIKLKNDVMCDELPDISSSAKLPGIAETTVREKLNRFINEAIDDYKTDRDIPALAGTSELSAALSIGTLSTRRCYVAARQAKTEGRTIWISELIWRDFYRAVMWHFPHVAKRKGFNAVDAKLNWNDSEGDFERWKHGKTGVPIVDAAMNQLNQTGWMHNRLRMIVASFLTKNLWVDWRKGEDYFSDQLFDFDFASNNGGWQWSASVGTDAAPYFRVFNPASQAQRFDPNAEFIRKWLPELERYSSKQIHNFEKQTFDNYPTPMVDLKQSRKQAIEAFKVAKEKFS